jgi:hypothetical protein
MQLRAGKEQVGAAGIGTVFARQFGVDLPVFEAGAHEYRAGALNAQGAHNFVSYRGQGGHRIQYHPLFIQPDFSLLWLKMNFSGQISADRKF